MRNIIIGIVFLFAGCTPIWTGNQMQDDIDQLRSDQALLNQNLVAKEKELSDMISNARAETTQLNLVLKEATALLQRNSADFGIEMEQIQKDIETIRGRTDQIKFSLEKMESAMKLFKEDTDLRFSETKVQTPMSEAELFSKGESLYKSGAYQEARSTFESYVTKYPKKRNTAGAYFYMGESFFGQKQYVNAIGAYEEILKAHLKSKYGDDATFRIGDSFSKLKKCKEAAIFYDSVIQDFRKSSYRKQAKKKYKKAKAGKC